MPFESPSPSDPHPDWHDLLAGYVLGNLSPEEQAIFQDILNRQPELKAEVLAYEETLALIPYALDPQAPPPDLENSLVAAIQSTARPSGRPQERRRSSRRLTLDRLWYATTLSAAAMLIALVGTNNYRLRQQQSRLQAELNSRQTEVQMLTEQLQTETQMRQTTDLFEQAIDILRQPNAQVYSLKGTGDALTSSGSLLTLPDHSEVQLVSHNLPVLPTGQVYRLWAVANEEAAPMFCGEFNNTDVGTAHWTVPNTLCSASPFKVIITIDAVVDPPVPKGPAVLTSGL